MPNIQNMDKNEEKSKNEKPVAIIILLVLCVLIFLGALYYNIILPTQLMDYGKKYVEIQQYDNALRIFRYMESLRPQDTEPIYYEVLTLSKMPPTYENQRRLYDIFQYDDCDEASEFAADVLSIMRQQIDKQAGTNYIDNVLFNDTLIRWNNNHPITYSIKLNAPTGNNLDSIAERAFLSWQEATNGELQFQKVNDNANIEIHVVYNLPDDKIFETIYSTAITVPDIKEDKLNQMNIFIKSSDEYGNPFEEDKLYSLLLHEIGHALGLGGHSANKDDVMYHEGDYINRLTTIKEISKRDLNTLNLLYKMVPDVIDIPLSENMKNNLLYHEIITTFPGENFEIETQKLIRDLKKDKNNIVKWVDLAINYGIKRKYQKSNYILERILPLVEYNPDNQFVVYYNMSLNHYRMKDYSLARTYLRLAEYIKEDRETEILSAFINIKENKLEEARKKLLILHSKNPGDIEISIKLAEIYYKEKNKKECKKIVQETIKENSSAKRDRRLMKFMK